MNTLEPGARLGAYQILNKLGEGGIGEVYRAQDSTLGRDVATKVLSTHFAADPAMMLPGARGRRPEVIA